MDSGLSKCTYMYKYFITDVHVVIHDYVCCKVSIVLNSLLKLFFLAVKNYFKNKFMLFNLFCIISPI